MSVVALFFPQMSVIVFVAPPPVDVVGGLPGPQWWSAKAGCQILLLRCFNHLYWEFLFGCLLYLSVDL